MERFIFKILSASLFCLISHNLLQGFIESDHDEMVSVFIKMRPVLPAMVVYSSADPSGIR